MAPLPDKAAAIAEAYRRGLLPASMAADYEAAARSGVVNDPYAASRGQARGQPVTGYLTTAARAVPGVTDLGAAWSAALRSADDLAHGRPADFGSRWNQARAQQQGVIDQFRSDHPIAANNAAALGALAPAAAALPIGMAPAAARLAAPAAGQGLGAVAGRVATGAARNAFTGGAIGAAYGFGQAGTLAERTANANRGVLPGALAGVAIPGAVAAATGLVSGGRALASGLASGSTADAGSAALGGAPPGSREALIVAFNRAVANHGLAPLGQSLPDNVGAGHEATAYLGRQTANAYDRAARAVTGFTKDPKLIADTQIRARMLPDDEFSNIHFKNVLRQTIAQPINMGGMTGEDILNMHSQLSEMADELKRQGWPAEPVGRVFDGLNDDIANAVDRQNPGYGALKRAADEAAAVHLRMARASQMANDNGGVFSPGEMREVLRQEDARQGYVSTANTVMPLWVLTNHAGYMQYSPTAEKIANFIARTPADYFRAQMFDSPSYINGPLQRNPGGSDPNGASSLRPFNTLGPDSVGLNTIGPAGVTAGSYPTSQTGQPDQN
jgi:hypothetical protein